MTEYATSRLASRRAVMKGASLAALVAGLAAPGSAQAYNPGPTETGPRYRADSPDVQAFYRTNGYETLKKG